MKHLPAAILAAAALGAAWASADDWPQFRGPGGASVAAVPAPVDWSIETGANVAWDADLPGRGVSGPIVVGGRVIVTASGGVNRTRLHVLAFDSLTGAPLWHRQFWAMGRTLCHDTSAIAANTPASDGERVFAMYSSNDLVCLDLDGNLLWMRALTQDHPGVGNDVGMASSPVVAGGAVIVQCESQRSSFAAAFDPESGEQLWQIDRPDVSAWASPVAVTYGEGEPGVVLQSGSDLALYDAATGRQVWNVPIACSGIPSAVAAAGRLVVPASGLTVLTLGGREPAVEWQSGRLQMGSSSPVVAGPQVYVINRGVLTCADVDGDNQSRWRTRLAGDFWATPLATDGRIYCFNTRGDGFVVSTEDGEVLSRTTFGDEIKGSPAAADGGLYVRTHGKLWKIASAEQALRGARLSQAHSD